jgi:hypothetical protein
MSGVHELEQQYVEHACIRRVRAAIVVEERAGLGDCPWVSRGATADGKRAAAVPAAAAVEGCRTPMTPRTAGSAEKALSGGVNTLSPLLRLALELVRDLLCLSAHASPTQRRMRSAADVRDRRRGKRKRKRMYWHTWGCSSQDECSKSGGPTKTQRQRSVWRAAWGKRRREGR